MLYNRKSQYRLCLEHSTFNRISKQVTVKQELTVKPTETAASVQKSIQKINRIHVQYSTKRTFEFTKSVERFL